MESTLPRLLTSSKGSHVRQDDFGQLVRTALRHLYDPVYLQTHPLARLVSGTSDAPPALGRRLAQLLLDAIVGLKPESRSSDARATRRYNLMTLRYVEALEIGEVAGRLGISRREYNREHRQALDAVVSMIQDGSVTSPSPTPRPTASTGARARIPTNRIPLPLTSFVGREREIQEVLNLLDSARLITLTGAPGTGKTRLALQVAEELIASSGSADISYPDGIYFVPLASISSPNLVISAIAQTLGVRDAPNRFLIESLEEHVLHYHMLLILDCC